ncbi:DUF998 domain-containing protein [Roseicyclus sp. F158]|uniref:DUF998 domain-containing protein n=1 Tax=Tropicimonas omnivorans TaxID=3075590 RepID=A0ABU3DI13_9RHOB|nr:DUF998 domain-containing protein [Roseicyclus sp. F158]MDT0683351.1 DUF998 domain-containing protein [Roseicyclus sp. F158]
MRTLMQNTLYTPGSERSGLLRILAVIAFAGVLALILGVLVAPFVVPAEYNWISDSISDLAAGQGEIVMDVALYGFAGALFALALAAAHSHLGRNGWTAAIFCLVLLAVLVVVIGARNEYGDNDTGGVVIHTYLVYALGALFVAVPVLMSAGASREIAWARPVLLGLAVLWAISSAIYLLSPDHIDGLTERLAGLVACAIVLVLGAVFRSRGRYPHR